MPKLMQQIEQNGLYLKPEWPRKPANVHAYTTLRTNSHAEEQLHSGPYGEFNLAAHVGDDLVTVELNRSRLAVDLQLPASPLWLDQIHSNKAIRLDQNSSMKQSLIQADASFTSTSGVVCAVLTADCLPVFFCNRAGTEVAVAHAGWRGLHAGILSKTIESMESAAAEIFAYFGPAIGPQSFEVGGEVLSAFVDKNENNKVAFTAHKKSHYLCDIYQLARLELQSLGIHQIDGGDFCSYKDQRFYSYRRQPITGRMASLIWLD